MAYSSEGTGGNDERAEYILARLDRLPSWGLSNRLIWALGFSWFVTLYDVAGNLGPSLPYMVQQGFFPGTLNQAVSEALFGAITLGVVGYPIGAVLLSYLADRIGRRPVMIASIALTGLGELGMALSPNYIIWYLFRVATAAGIGGDLGLVVTYISEMSPSAKRGKYLNNTYIGGWVGIGLGGLLATQIVVNDPSTGWRITFAIAAMVGILALVVRTSAPESLRHLVKRGKFDEAESLVSRMELASMKRAGVTSLPEPIVKAEYRIADENPLKAIANRKYLTRIVFLFLFWFFLDWFQYPYAVGWNTYFTSSFGYSPSDTSTFIFIGGFLLLGTTAGAILVRFFADRFDRRVLATLAAASFPVCIYIALLGGPTHNYDFIVPGVFIANLITGGFVVQLMFLITAENFPTASRGTGFSLTNGLGSIGTAISPTLLLSLTSAVGPLYAFPLMALPVLFVGLAVIVFIPRTVGKTLEEVNEASVPTHVHAASSPIGGKDLEEPSAG